MDKNKLPHNHGEETNQILKNLPETKDFEKISELFKLLGDSKRVKIFWILCHTESCVINLSAIMEMSSPAVSHHLKFLKSAGLIESRRDGKEVYYKAAQSALVKTLHNMLKKVTEVTCPDTCNFSQKNVDK
ncbi:MAG: winged helix-turn-helix transcriptional regulator [Clostridia bacterium]|nr:winged helix-turn-helix transcriptional regulator [Clostridia bacterium]